MDESRKPTLLLASLPLRCMTPEVVAAVDGALPIERDAVILGSSMVGGVSAQLGCSRSENDLAGASELFV